MSDLVWRLRDNGKSSAWSLYDEAADRIEQLEREVAELTKCNHRLNKEFDDVASENHALTAHVEQLQGCGNTLESLSGGNIAVNLARAEWRKLESQSPQSSLAEVIAKAKEEQAEESYADALCDVPNLLDSEYGIGDIVAMCHILAEYYANKIRNRRG